MSGVIETIEVVDVRDIEPMPVRIRKMDDAERQLLVLSIKELGYVEPIQVCRYTIETDIVKRAPPFYLIVNFQFSLARSVAVGFDARVEIDNPLSILSCEISNG